MRTEANFSSYIQRKLIDKGIDARLEGDVKNIELLNAFKTASKSLTGNAGYPDIVAVVKDFVLIMENKSDHFKLERKIDGADFSEQVDDIKNYAVNGANFYAKKVFESTDYKKIFAFGNAGDEVHHTFKPVFIGEVTKTEKNKKGVPTITTFFTIKELPAVETFIDFTDENIEKYYIQAVLGEELKEAKELKKVIKHAGTLHEYLRNYGQLGETEKPLVVSAIILAMDDGLKLDELKGNSEENQSDGEIIYNHIENRLNTADIKPEIKKERVLAQFQLIKNRPLLNAVHSSLDKTPLKFFAEYIENHVYEKVKTSGSIDYLGKFYREFVSYSGGDGQTLGVVLTPEHITKLFCDLVNLKADDIVLDPCCGTGGFLIAAMDRMIKLADNEKLRENIKKNQLHGVEVRDDMFSIATTSMILRGDGKSNLICDDFLSKTAKDFLPAKFTVGFMNPPYSQAKNDATRHLSELRFIEHLLNCMTPGARVAVIVPVSAMIGKTKDDKVLKREILKHHTLKGVISLNKNTFYQIGTVPCIAVFIAGQPHKKNFKVKFINFEDDGFELRKHEGYVETYRAAERKEYLLDCWNDNVADYPSKFMVETPIDADDEWLHSFYYYNDELPTDADFENTVADYLTFEFNMIAHGRGYLFDNSKKNFVVTDDVPPLQNKKWQTFNLADIFSIRATASGIDKNKLNLISGKIPYVTRTDKNNGIQNFICEQENYLVDNRNCITVGLDTQTAFYQPTEFYTGQNIQILKNDKLNILTAKFLLPLIKKTLSIFSWGGNGATLTRLKRSKILLPVNELGEPDFEYMEKYIALREQKLIQQYLDYICPPNVSEIVTLNEKIWKPFFIEDIFEIVSGRDIYEDERIVGNIPYIGASANNNGICHFINNKNETLENNCISVNRNGSVGYAFYHPYTALYSNDCRKLRPHFSGKYISLFLVHQIQMQKEKYNYGYKMGTGRLKKQKIKLPVTESGEPDFEYMELYSRNIFAQILKRYLERV